MIMGEKQDRTIKGKTAYHGKPTREWLSREESSSPITALKSIIRTGVIDAHEERNAMTCHIPNAFLQSANAGNQDWR